MVFTSPVKLTWIKAWWDPERLRSLVRIEADVDTYADTGTLTLTKVDANGFFGTLAMTFGGDHVTGSFAAPVCDPPPSGPTCEP